MEITYIGHSCFKIRGKAATVVTDPFNETLVGLKFPKIEADVVTVSHQHEDHNNFSVVSGSPLLVSGPGEYEIHGVKIIGVSSYHDNSSGHERGVNTVYRIEIDKISLVHCGDLGHKLDEKKLEMLDGVDIVMIPIGGFYTISASEASEIISQLDPKIIIPMHYNTLHLNQDTLGKLASVDAFLKEMGKIEVKPVDKLSISRERLPEEPTIVVLKY